MRISNLQFGKGSIIYANFSRVGEMAYLNNRPLIIVSNPIHIFDRVIVCTTGTQHKPGIKISLYDYKLGKYVGDIEESTIYPNTLMTIDTSKIRQVLGTLDPFIMREVDKAVQFFMGYTEEIPEYLKNYSHVYGVEYEYPITGYIHQNEKVAESVANDFSACINPMPTTPPPTSSTESVVKTKSDEISDFVDKCCILEPSAQTRFQDLFKAYDYFADLEGKHHYGSPQFARKFISFCRDKQITRVRDEFNNYYTGIGLTEEIQQKALKLTSIDLKFEKSDSDEIIKWASGEEKIQYSDLNDLRDQIVLSGPPNNAAYIASRQASLKAVSIKYGLDLESAKMLRKIVTANAINRGRAIVNEIDGNMGTPINTIDMFTKVGIVLAIHIKMVEPKSKTLVRLNKVIIQTKKMFDISFSDQEKWKDPIM